MADSVNYGGELSLDQLSQMTRQQQYQNAQGVPLTKDGKPAPYTNTNDLTGNKSADPLGDFVNNLRNEREGVAPPVPGATITKPNVYNPKASQEQQPTMSQPVASTSQKTGGMKKLDPYDIAPPKINEDAQAVSEFRNKLITDLDKAIERDKQEMWDNVVEPLYRQKLEEKMLAEGNGTGDVDGESFDIDMTEDDDDFEDNDEVGDFGMNDEVKSTLVTDDGQQGMPDPDITPVAAPPVQQPAVEEEVLAGKAEYVSEDIPTPKEEVKTTTTTINTSAYDDMAESDFDDVFGTNADDDDDEDSPLDDEVQAAIAEDIKTKVKSFNNVINLAEFTVSSKATSGSKVLSHINQARNTQVGTWALVNAGRPITMTAMYGDEIEKLNPDSTSSDLSDFQKQKQIFSIFYDHTVDANKPATFEAWTKTIPAADIQNLYFCAYRATFGNGSNFLPRQCNNSGCKNGWLELTDLDKMVKYKDDAAKKRIQDILRMEGTSDDLNIKAALYQISDELCVSIKPPSIYSMVFEDMVLNRAFKSKYAELAGWIACIEDIYVIDRNTKQLVKVKPKVEPNNMTKTTNNKYKTYAAILKTLSSDQYVYTISKINEIQLKYNNDISFVLPETKCPKCGTSIAEDPKMNAVMAFFIRHRLQTATRTSNV